MVREPAAAPRHRAAKRRRSSGAILKDKGGHIPHARRWEFSSGPMRPQLQMKTRLLEMRGQWDQSDDPINEFENQDNHLQDYDEGEHSPVFIRERKLMPTSVSPGDPAKLTWYKPIASEGDWEDIEEWERWFAIDDDNGTIYVPAASTTNRPQALVAQLALFDGTEIIVDDENHFYAPLDWIGRTFDDCKDHARQMTTLIKARVAEHIAENSIKH
jgi:hypothetical protein